MADNHYNVAQPPLTTPNRTPRQRILDAHEDIDRLIAQTEALMLLLTSDGVLDSLYKHSIDDSLWLVSDRIRDIKAACNRLYEAQKLEAANGEAHNRS